MEAGADLSRAQPGQSSPVGTASDGIAVARRPIEAIRAEKTVETSQRQDHSPVAVLPKSGYDPPNGIRGTSMRPSIHDTMSPSSAESSQYAARPMQLPMAESRQEEDFLMNLAAHPGMSGRGFPPSGQRYPAGMMMLQEGAPPLARLAPRALYPEDEATIGYQAGSSLPSGFRYARAPMPPPAGMHLSGSPARTMNHSTAEASPQAGRRSSEDLRELGGRQGVPASPRTPAGNLQRSASEGLMRSPGISSHHRTGSAGGLQEERLMARMATEAPQNLLNPRGGESPDFAMIYAFLGSMFDPVCYMINHHDVLTQMCDIDRETSILLLSNISANLDAHGQEIFGRYLNSALQAPPNRRGAREHDVCHMINHLDVMQQMTPLDRETACLILDNCVNNFGDPGCMEELERQLLPMQRSKILHSGALPPAEEPQ